MASLTLAISAEIKQKMYKFKYINWAEVAREAIIDKVRLLEKMNKLLAQSNLTEEDTIKYGRMIKKRQWSKTKRLLS